jgi:hypothetical protein
MLIGCARVSTFDGLMAMTRAVRPNWSMQLHSATQDAYWRAQGTIFAVIVLAPSAKGFAPMGNPTTGM